MNVLLVLYSDNLISGEVFAASCILWTVVLQNQLVIRARVEVFVDDANAKEIIIH